MAIIKKKKIYREVYFKRYSYDITNKLELGLFCKLCSGLDKFAPRCKENIRTACIYVYNKCINVGYSFDNYCYIYDTKETKNKE